MPELIMGQKDKLERLKNILEMVDADKPSFDDLAKYFMQLITALQTHAQKVEKALATGELKAEKELEKFIKQIEKYSLEKKGEPGKDADEGKIVNEVLSRIPIPKNGIDGSPDTPEQVRDKLETLEGDDRLDKKAIKGLEEQIDELRSLISSRPSGTMRGMRKIPIIKRYNLSSQCDGVTKSFTLPHGTVDVVGVWGTQFPITFNPLTDWTFSGRTLTLTDEVSAPATGQTLFAIIETLFYG